MSDRVKASRAVKRAWARSGKVKSLKAWACIQIQQDKEYAPECQQWFENKT